MPSHWRISRDHPGPSVDKDGAKKVNRSESQCWFGPQTLAVDSARGQHMLRGQPCPDWETDAGSDMQPFTLPSLGLEQLAEVPLRY